MSEGRMITEDEWREFQYLRARAAEVERHLSKTVDFLTGTGTYRVQVSRVCMVGPEQVKEPSGQIKNLTKLFLEDGAWITTPLDQTMVCAKLGGIWNTQH